MGEVGRGPEKLGPHGPDYATPDASGGASPEDEMLTRRDEYERTFSDRLEIEDIISHHPDPNVVRYALRVIELMEGTTETNGEARRDWPVSRREEVLQNRAVAARIPTKDLMGELGVVEPLTDEEKELIRTERGKSIPANLHEDNFAKPKYEHIEGFGLETYSVQMPKIESFRLENGKKVDIRYRIGRERFVYLGDSNEKRIEKSQEFSDMKNELTARYLMMQIWKHHVMFYYALQKLAEGHYFNPTLSSKGLGVLFNLKGLEGASKETSTKVELRTLGDKIDTAMRIYYVAALCEKPSRFKKLMKTPGWEKFLFPKGTSQEIIEKLIGKPDEWEDETEAGGHRTKQTTKEERECGLRGDWTRKNIFAESNPYILGKLEKSIEEFLGGGKGASHKNQIEAETARRIGYLMFRLFLLADKEGYELLEAEKKGNRLDPFDGLDVVFENAPAGSDFGKLMYPALYMCKSFRKGRNFAPPIGYLNSRKFYPRLMVDFLRQVAAPTEVAVKENGKEIKIVENRSLMERWWGYREEELVVTVFDENGKEGKIKRKYLDEPALRLGDLPWEDFNEVITFDEEAADIMGLPVGGYHHEVFKGFWLTGFMGGRDGGTFDLISDTVHDPKDLLDEGWWRKFYKLLDVGIKPGVALNGVFRGTPSKREQSMRVKRLILGVIRAYITGVLHQPEAKRWDTEREAWGREGILGFGGNREAVGRYLTDRIIETANNAIPGLNYVRRK